MAAHDMCRQIDAKNMQYAKNMQSLSMAQKADLNIQTCVSAEEATAIMIFVQ